jgi:leucyl/phenylalanyl-tRNA--protein transferase
MDGWIAQWYVNVPGVSKRVVDDAPWVSGPELQAPLSDVHVWVALSRFVTVTDEPRRISSGFGEKAKSAIVSAAFEGAAGCVGAVVVGGVVVRGAVVVGGGAVVAGRDVVVGVAAGNGAAVGGDAVRGGVTVVGAVGRAAGADASDVGAGATVGAVDAVDGVDVGDGCPVVVTAAAADRDGVRSPPPLPPPHPAAASPSATTITSPVRTSDIRPGAPAGSPPAAGQQNGDVRPVDPGPSEWALPDPDTTDDPSGLVGFGADLEPATLVDAYRRGLFPWPHDGLPLPWFSPDPRGVIDPRHVHVSRSLRKAIARSAWHAPVDRAFDDVVHACASRSRHEGTWITRPMRKAYRTLHRLGWAPSGEVWSGDGSDRLVGGLYGVQLGGVFTGESMFHRATDASKVALVELARRLTEAGGTLIDVQLVTPHLESLGAVEIPRDDFLARLARHRDDDVDLDESLLPVTRLVG